VYQSKKRGQGSGAMYAVENLDIEQGLNLARVMQQPYVNGRKIIRYYSKRTNKSAVISIIDPAYLLAGNQVSERPIEALERGDGHGTGSKERAMRASILNSTAKGQAGTYRYS
jgi:hypothetical protein